MSDETDTQARPLLKGDLGLVKGRVGVWTVTAGARCPDGIFPVTKSAIEAAIDKDVLTIWAPGQGTRECRRDEFTWLGDATPEQRTQASTDE